MTVMKFINTKTFFQIFLQKITIDVYLFYYQLAKRNKGVPSCVLTQSIFSQKGMALPKAGFGSLFLFWDWITLKAPKLFPTVVHAGLVGPPILTHYGLQTERVQSEWKCFTSPYGGFHPTRAGY